MEIQPSRDDFVVEMNGMGGKKTRLLFQLIIDPFVLSFIENHSIYTVVVSRFVERGPRQQFLDHLFDTRLTFIMSSNVRGVILCLLLHNGTIVITDRKTVS